jgi:hypothetical protein
VNRDCLKNLFAPPRHACGNAVGGAHDLAPEERPEFALALRNGPLRRPRNLERLIEEVRVAQNVTQRRILQWVYDRRKGCFDLRQLRIVERRNAHNGVLDPRRLQEARAHLIDRIVAARKDDAHAWVRSGQRHEVAERITRGLLE